MNVGEIIKLYKEKNSNVRAIDSAVPLSFSNEMREKGDQKQYCWLYTRDNGCFGEPISVLKMAKDLKLKGYKICHKGMTNALQLVTSEQYDEDMRDAEKYDVSTINIPLQEIF